MLAKHFPPVARTLQLIQSFCWRLSSLLAKLDRFYSVIDSNPTNPVIISSLKAFIALICVSQKPANQIGTEVFVSFWVQYAASEWTSGGPLRLALYKNTWSWQ